jgi:hypothetical protein
MYDLMKEVDVDDWEEFVGKDLFWSWKSACFEEDVDEVVKKFEGEKLVWDVEGRLEKAARGFEKLLLMSWVL